MFIDDLKMFAQNEEQINSMKTIHLISDGIGMEFGSNWKTMVRFDWIKLPNEESTKDVEQKNGYMY